MEKQRMLPIIQVGDVLLSPEILTEKFCCDIMECHGQCCVEEGDSGAPVTLDETVEIEEALDVVWNDLSASAQAVIDKQGVAYSDSEGDLVTSIVAGRDCVFTCYVEDNCMCALEKAFRTGKIKFCKPISCALYPIREKKLSDGKVALNYNRWDICADAVKLGKKLNLPLYKFLKEPLIRRFGKEWYDELEETAKALL